MYSIFNLSSSYNLAVDTVKIITMLGDRTGLLNGKVNYAYYSTKKKNYRAKESNGDIGSLGPRKAPQQLASLIFRLDVMVYSCRHVGLYCIYRMVYHVSDEAHPTIVSFQRNVFR